MPRSSEYVYDPKTGKWVKKNSSDNNNKNNNKNTTKKKENKKPAKTNNDDDKKGSSSSDVKKKQNKINLNTLTGTLNYIATNSTIKIKAGDTITLSGIGKNLSGRYYVQDVTRSYSNSGYTHSATLLKTNMGSTLKLKSKNSKGKSDSSSKDKKKAKSSGNSTTRTYTVKKGDTIYTIAKHFYKKSSAYTKIVNVNKLKKPYKLKIGQKLIIP